MEKQESILKLGLILAAICVAAAVALGTANWLTRDKIAAQRAKKQRQALEVVLPGASSFSAPITGTKINYYRGLDKNGKIIGYAFAGASRGYSSLIRVMVGVDLNGEITGIEITEEKETPGLGTKSEEIPVGETLWEAIAGGGKKETTARPRFQTQFGGKTLEDLRVVTVPTDTNIEALTGATITSRAVTRAVRESLEKFMGQTEKKIIK